MKYIKKPIVVDAVQWTGANIFITERWMDGSGAAIDYSEKQLGVIKIPTGDGIKSAYAGDWIIKDDSGKFYPCKQEVFEETYMAVKDATIEELKRFSENNFQ